MRKKTFKGDDNGSFLAENLPGVTFWWHLYSDLTGNYKFYA